MLLYKDYSAPLSKCLYVGTEPQNSIHLFQYSVKSSAELAKGRHTICPIVYIRSEDLLKKTNDL